MSRLRPFRTRRGEHGLLYLYEMIYFDRCDPAFEPTKWRCWAYDQEHARDQFYADPSAEGFSLLRSMSRIREKGAS